MVIVGKTKPDEFAMGSSTENSAYGATHIRGTLIACPGFIRRKRRRLCGPLCPAALGTTPAAASDTGVAVRVTGLKTTYAGVRYGLVAFRLIAGYLGAFGPNGTGCVRHLLCHAGGIHATHVQPTLASLESSLNPCMATSLCAACSLACRGVRDRGHPARGGEGRAGGRRTR